jgi:hypothetical protein
LHVFAASVAEMASFGYGTNGTQKIVGNKLKISINNYSGPRVEYAKTNISPTLSIKSLPELGGVIAIQPKRTTEENLRAEEEELESISKRTRSKKMFC